MAQVKVCKQCGKLFQRKEAKGSGGKFCSRECYKLSKRVPKVVKVCSYCKRTFAIYPSEAKKSPGRFCSRKCHMDAWRDRLDSRPLQLNFEAEQIILGSLMGDANIRAGRVNFTHRTQDSPYLQWKYTVLKKAGWVNTRIRREYIEKGDCYTASFYTIQHPYFRHLSTYFYKDSCKKIDPWVLARLNSLGLAVWYQDDGSLRWVKRNYRLTLHTESFDFETCRRLQSWLEDTCKVQFCLHFHQSEPILEVSNKEGVRKFINIVKPFIHPSMRRKIPPGDGHRS